MSNQALNDQYPIPARYFDIANKGYNTGDWVALHALADAFPETPSDTDKQKIKEFFKLKAYFSPCETCGTHFQQVLEEFPIECDTGLQLSRWLINAHNIVNQRCGHPVLSYEEAVLAQKWFRAIQWGKVAKDLRSGRLQYRDQTSEESKPLPSIQPLDSDSHLIEYKLEAAPAVARKQVPLATAAQQEQREQQSPRVVPAAAQALPRQYLPTQHLPAQQQTQSTQNTHFFVSLLIVLVCGVLLLLFLTKLSNQQVNSPESHYKYYPRAYFRDTLLRHPFSPLY